MSAPQSIEKTPPFGWTAVYLASAIFLSPFIYLTSLSLLHSAYAHGFSMPSRAFLGAYAAPSNVMASTPGIGRLFSAYYEVCSRVTGADYDPAKKQQHYGCFGRRCDGALIACWTRRA
jgi:hypothetical protein